MAQAALLLALDLGVAGGGSAQPGLSGTLSWCGEAGHKAVVSAGLVAVDTLRHEEQSAQTVSGSEARTGPTQAPAGQWRLPASLMRSRLPWLPLPSNRQTCRVLAPSALRR